MKQLTRMYTNLSYAKNKPPFKLELDFLITLQKCQTKRQQLELIQKFFNTRIMIQDELTWKHHFINGICNGKVNFNDLVNLYPNIKLPNTGTISLGNLGELYLGNLFGHSLGEEIEICSTKEILNQRNQIIDTGQKNPDYKIKDIYWDAKFKTFQQNRLNQISHVYSSNEGQVENIYNNNVNLDSYNFSQILFCRTVQNEIENYNIDINAKTNLIYYLTQNITLLAQNKIVNQSAINKNWYNIKLLLNKNKIMFAHSILMYDESNINEFPFKSNQEMTPSLLNIFENYLHEKNITSIYSRALEYCTGQQSQLWLQKMKTGSFTNNLDQVIKNINNV